MTWLQYFTIASNLRTVCIATFFCALTAATYGTPATSATSPASGATKSPTATLPTNPSKPLWTDLTAAQQLALAPLAVEWNQLGPIGKEKWLKIGNKYASMSLDEQHRVQEKMREWIKLTPEQRRIVRENYARSKKIEPDQKSAKWEQYQHLPDEKKKTLADSAITKKQVTNLPSASQAVKKPIPPIKSATKKAIVTTSTSTTTHAPTTSTIAPQSIK